MLVIAIGFGVGREIAHMHHGTGARLGFFCADANAAWTGFTKKVLHRPLAWLPLSGVDYLRNTLVRPVFFIQTSLPVQLLS